MIPQVVSVNQLKDRAESILAQVRHTDDVVIVTMDGEEAAILVDVEEYRKQIATLDELRHPDSLERLARANSERGFGIPHDEVKARFLCIRHGRRQLPDLDELIG